MKGSLLTGGDVASLIGRVVSGKFSLVFSSVVILLLTGGGWIDKLININEWEGCSWRSGIGMRMVGNIWKGQGIDAIHIDLLGIKHHHHALLLL